MTAIKNSLKFLCTNIANPNNDRFTKLGLIKAIDVAERAFVIAIIKINRPINLEKKIEKSIFSIPTGCSLLVVFFSFLNLKGVPIGLRFPKQKTVNGSKNSNNKLAVRFMLEKIVLPK